MHDGDAPFKSWIEWMSKIAKRKVNLMTTLAYKDKIRVRGTAQEAAMRSPLALKIGKVNHGLNTALKLWDYFNGQHDECICCYEQKK